MDFMKIEGFLGVAISKLINKAIESKIGFKPGIKINTFNLGTIVDTRNREETIEVTLTANMTRAAFERLIEEATK